MDILGIRGLQVRRSIGVALGGQRAPAALWRRATSTATALCLALLLLAGCATSATTGPTPTAVPTATPSGILPAFGDWRVAYYGQDTRLHVVTLDGKTDLLGALLPPLGSSGLAYIGGASPDGHRLAYYGADGLTIIDLTASDPAKIVLQEPRAYGFDIAWSPDGARLAYSSGNSLGLADASTGAVTPIPGWQNSAPSRIAGWIDNRHLAVVPTKGSTPTSIVLASVDVAMGAARTVATLPIAAYTGVDVTLTPDRTQALVRNHPPTGHSVDFPPLIELVSTATGQVRPLPGIAKAVGFLLYPIAWKPGAQLAAATPNYEEFDLARPSTQSWLLDFAHDSATKLTTGQFCLGWVPGADTLVLSTSYRAEPTGQAHTLSAATLAAATLGQPVTLTTSATTFPFLGFVRTA